MDISSADESISCDAYFEEIEEEVVEERNGDVEGLGLHERHPPHLLADPPHPPHSPPGLPREVSFLLRTAYRADLLLCGQAGESPSSCKKDLLGAAAAAGLEKRRVRACS